MIFTPAPSLPEIVDFDGDDDREAAQAQRDQANAQQQIKDAA